MCILDNLLNFSGFQFLYHYQFSSVHFICSVMSDSLRPYGLQHGRLPCPTPTPGACSNACPWSWWCHPTISSSVIPFSSCFQSCPALGSFPMSQFFTSGGLSIEVSASASVLPMNIQNWFPLGWTGLISLQSKGNPQVFSNTTVQKHQFFGAQLSSWKESRGGEGERNDPIYTLKWEAWRTAAHGVPKNRTQLSDWTAKL